MAGLLFLVTVINYVDRQVFSILAPDLQDEIGWSELDYGRIVIAFQVSYALMTLGAGRLLDRIGTKLGFALAVAAWSVVAMGHALARSPAGFGAARFLLGMTEAANFPAAVKTVAERFPAGERAMATGIFNSGVAAGTIVASIAVPLITAAWGWRAAFVATGAVGLLWLPLWWWFYKDGGAAPAATARRWCRGGRCSASNRPGPTRWPSAWPIRSGGSTCSGCRSSSPPSTACAALR